MVVPYVKSCLSLPGMIANPNVKINLGLNVLRRREDGYHDLETLFVPYYGISDTLEIVTSDDWSRTLGRIMEGYPPECVAQAISPDARVMITIARREGVDWDPLKDLTVRAFFLLSEHYDLPPVKIFLEKTSPVGAGLGGGSADAAFALRMLSGMFGLDLSDGSLAGYAAALGSDCAFFVYDRPMFGEGRGEILSPFPLPLDTRRYRMEVRVPEGISVSTADAYRGIVPGLPARPLREVLGEDVTLWKDSLVNDFEKTVFRRYPALAAFKRSLYEEGAVYASMSGSGSAFFAIFEK